jgi:hypothetical protein
LNQETARKGFSIQSLVMQKLKKVFSVIRGKNLCLETLEMTLTEQESSLDFLFNNVDLYLKWSSIVRLFFKNAALYTYSASSVIGLAL